MTTFSNKKNVTEEFASKFKQSYFYKMGGTQTVILPNGQQFIFNDKQYYSGRGAKYNGSVNHHSIGDVIVSKKEFNDELKKEAEYRKSIKECIKAKIHLAKKYEEFKSKGIYEIKENGYVQLSDEESTGRFFDAPRLSKTLNISIEDAKLLQSTGKTYVFSKQISTGKIIQLYHSSLSCNYLSISISYPTSEEIASFNHDEWASAPYARLLGQTSNINHFVC